MIILDLDGTLADCKHRRHLVDPKENPNVVHGIPPSARTGGIMIMRDYYKDTGKLFEPDYRAFEELCDEDEPIDPTICVLNYMRKSRMDIEIWSGRSEAVRVKTEHWIEFNCFPFSLKKSKLRMRPEGDFTPDEQLKERWLDEHIAGGGKPIQFVFDDRKKVIEMWRRRGIFVFDCNQGREF